MQEIRCPKCGEVFQVDESGYAAIVKQVRDKEFEKQIREREQTLQAERELSIENAVVKAVQERETEIADLKAKLALAEAEKKQLNERAEAEKKQLSERAEAEKKQLSEKAAYEKKQISELAEVEKKQLNERAEADRRTALADKELEITRLKGELENQEMTKKLEIQAAVQERERQISELKNQLTLEQSDRERKEQTLKEQYAAEVKLKEEELERYKDFKLRQSTKMIGESLEQHCEMEFNKLRATGFRNAYFEKDNDSSGGSKGDYIYRESSEEGVEFISIMFEMKNEADETATKHKNEDFFKKLDKDRNEKQCEYAVLVSMLEADSELYNSGIVDVSYRYPKMYVIRPQFFIPMITLLRNAALNSLEYKRELVDIRSKNIDVTHFEDALMDFKEKFSYNYGQASKRFEEAIAEIDKSMEHLQKIKDALLKTDNHLRLANNKAEDLTIKKLTRNNPTMKAMFEEARQGDTK